MKAWVAVNVCTGEQEVVFADTRGKAKQTALRVYWAEHGYEFTDIRVKRFKEIDDREYMLEDDLRLLLVEEHGWWYEWDGVIYDAENVEELMKKMNNTFGGYKDVLGGSKK